MICSTLSFSWPLFVITFLFPPDYVCWFPGLVYYLVTCELHFICCMQVKPLKCKSTPHFINFLLKALKPCILFLQLYSSYALVCVCPLNKIPLKHVEDSGWKLTKWSWLQSQQSTCWHRFGIFILQCCLVGSWFLYFNWSLIIVWFNMFRKAVW